MSNDCENDKEQAQQEDSKVDAIAAVVIVAVLVTMSLYYISNAG